MGGVSGDDATLLHNVFSVPRRRVALFVSQTSVGDLESASTNVGCGPRNRMS